VQSMKSIVNILGCVILYGIVTVGMASAQSFDNSLWIGNDTGSSIGVLNTDTTGVVLRTLPNVSATGFAVDVAHGKLYIAEGLNVISEWDLNTLAAIRRVGVAGISFFEDLTFDGTNIWAVDFFGGIAKIDPTSLTVISSFVPAGIQFPRGIAWDGSGLW